MSSIDRAGVDIVDLEEWDEIEGRTAAGRRSRGELDRHALDVAGTRVVVADIYWHNGERELRLVDDGGSGLADLGAPAMPVGRELNGYLSVDLMLPRLGEDGAVRRTQAPLSELDGAVGQDLERSLVAAGALMVAQRRTVCAMATGRRSVTIAAWQDPEAPVPFVAYALTTLVPLLAIAPQPAAA